MPAPSAGSSAAGAPGSARRSVSIVGSAATAASSSAARVAGGRAPIRASTRAPSVSGIGRRSPGVTDGARPGEVAGDLEGVERIAARRLLDPDEHEARERPAGPGQEQLVQGRQRQRADVRAARAARQGRRRSARGPATPRLAADRAGGRPPAGRRGAGSRRPGSPPRLRRATGRRRSRGPAAARRRARAAASPWRPTASAGPAAGRTARRAGSRSRGRAAARRAARPARPSVTVDRRSVRPPSVSVRSDSAGAARRTRAPARPARSIAARQIAVLPIPASPSMRRLASPVRASSSSRSTASSSAVRPMRSVFMHQKPGSAGPRGRVKAHRAAARP